VAPDEVRKPIGAWSDLFWLHAAFPAPPMSPTASNQTDCNCSW
jgi:hypothetical protein